MTRWWPILCPSWTRPRNARPDSISQGGADTPADRNFVGGGVPDAPTENRTFL